MKPFCEYVSLNKLCVLIIWDFYKLEFYIKQVRIVLLLSETSDLRVRIYYSPLLQIGRLKITFSAFLVNT